MSGPLAHLTVYTKTIHLGLHGVMSPRLCADITLQTGRDLNRASRTPTNRLARLLCERRRVLSITHDGQTGPGAENHARPGLITYERTPAIEDPPRPSNNFFVHRPECFPQFCRRAMCVAHLGTHHREECVTRLARRNEKPSHTAMSDGRLRRLPVVHSRPRNHVIYVGP